MSLQTQYENGTLNRYLDRIDREEAMDDYLIDLAEKIAEDRGIDIDALSDREREELCEMAMADLTDYGWRES